MAIRLCEAWPSTARDSTLPATIAYAPTARDSRESACGRLAYPPRLVSGPISDDDNVIVFLEDGSR